MNKYPTQYNLKAGMQYKNIPKNSYKQFSYEEQQLGRQPAKRLYSPKYSTQNSQHYSPRNQSSQFQSSGSPRHWKSYLAPELARLSPRDADIDYEGQQLHETGSSRLKGYSSVYNLRQGDTNNLSMEDRANGSYGNSTQQVRKEEYSRRKEEIMNRIKLLQDRAGGEEDPRGQNSGIRILNPAQNQNPNPTSEDLASRVTALQQRVESLGVEFQSRMKKELAEVERRLRSELKLK